MIRATAFSAIAAMLLARIAYRIARPRDIDAYGWCDVAGVVALCVLDFATELHIEW